MNVSGFIFGYVIDFEITPITAYFSSWHNYSQEASKP
jgi:hypothetical protein